VKARETCFVGTLVLVFAIMVFAVAMVAMFSRKENVFVSISI
jgi:hypothetical protein